MFSFKKILILIIFGLGTFFYAGQIKAQESDLLLKRDVYLADYQEYISARQSFLNQETLQKKEILTQKLRDFLYSRDALWETYLGILIKECQNHFSTEELTTLKNWQGWFEQEKGQINSVSSIDKLIVIGNQLNPVYPELEKIIYTFLVRLTIAQQNEVVVEIDQIRSRILENLDQFKDKRGNVPGWLDDLSVKLELVRENQVMALKQVNITVYRQGDVIRGFNRADTLLSTGNQKLKESLDFIDEILKNFSNEK